MATGWHDLDVDSAIAELKADPARGLAPAEAARRLAEYGPNELTQEERTSPWQLFFNQFKNILVVILIVATVLSAFVGEYVDAVIIGVIILFCAVLGFVQEYRAEKALDALKNMLTPMITVLRGGKEEEVPSKDLVPGDIMVLEAGDKIPADARVIENHSLQCDEAPLTGESLPVTKEAGRCARMRRWGTAGTWCSPALPSPTGGARRWCAPPACAPSSARSHRKWRTSRRRRRRSSGAPRRSANGWASSPSASACWCWASA